MANLYFKSVHLKNFMSYREASVILDRTGTILVGGVNNNPEDGASSNGCGKSSLFSAISWCLTGETVSGAKEVSNIYFKDKTEVSVEFDFDNSSYRITRTKNPSNLFIYVNGENKSGKGIRDTDIILKKYLPQLSSTLINSVVILGQGLPQRFTNNTPAGRKEVLEQLSNSDAMISDLKERLDSRNKSLKFNERDLEDTILKIKTRLEINEREIKTLQYEISSLPTEDSLIYNKILVESKLRKLDEERIELEKYVESLTELLNEKIVEKDVLTKEYVDGLKKLSFDNDSIFSNELLDVSSDIKALSTKILELDSVSDTCPTCGQKLPSVHKIDTTSLKEELKKKKDRRVYLQKAVEDIRNRNDSLKESYNNSYDEKFSELSSCISVHSEDIDMQKSKLDNIIRSIIEYNSELESINKKLSSIDVEKKVRQNNIQKLEEESKILEDKLYSTNVELDNIKERLNVISKMSTLVKRDFRGYLLGNVISYIESRAKLYALDVFGTDKLSFCLSGNNIDISYDGKDYSVLSGGEKQKLDVVIQFAIRDMLSTFLGFSSNILVLDEITDSLDSIGVSKVFNLINSNLTDVNAIYIISHHVDELEIPADDEIIIIKGVDKISRIV